MRFFGKILLPLLLVLPIAAYAAGSPSSSGSVVKIDQNQNGVVINSGTVGVSGGTLDQGAPNSAANAWPTTCVDSGGTSCTNTADHAVNAHITNNGNPKNTASTSQNYSPIAGYSATNCDADTGTTNTNLNPVNINLKGSVCVDLKSSVGTAGTANAQVLSIQGIASMTPVQIDLTKLGGTTLVNGGLAGTLAIGGSSAVGASTTENPVFGGCRGTTATPTAVTDGQKAALQCGAEGVLIVRPYSIRQNYVSGTTSAMTGTTSTSLIAASGTSNIFFYMTTLSCVNSHATVGTFVSVQDGNGGTTYWTVAAAAVYGGTVITFPVPLKQPTANTAMYVADVTTGANVICSAAGYYGP